MKHDLYPPLPLLEADLFGADATAQASQQQPDLDAAPAMPSADHDMPAHLRELVRRRVEADAAYPSAPPAVGQVRRLDAVPGLEGAGRAVGRSFGVLLGASLGGRRWSGWLVAQEGEYAGERDLVLQDEDGVADPVAAMVQAWNPVEVVLRGDEAIVGKLPAATLGAVVRLGDPGFVPDDVVLPRPGRIGAWDLDRDTTVVTGTPLGEQDDPRHGYQALYRALAQEVSAAAKAKPAPAQTTPRRTGWLHWLQDTFVRPAWTFGALAVVALQGAWMLGLHGPQPDDALVYRSVTPPLAQACAPRLRVMFRPDSVYADVIVTLRRVDASLVDGPSETGEVWIAPARDQAPQELAAMLRQSRLVEQVDLIEPDPRLCRQ
ncbi:hypothetical protein [Telluria beijingensis]|uniref:hypothetical protein n=1 Tax=Telluria beijingensis TaxID=3068633 RepID=UPI00279539F2|nr:hypothetical protein [Massilia sp. REN29]